MNKLDLKVSSHQELGRQLGRLWGSGWGGHRETHSYVQPLSAELLPIIWVRYFTARWKRY